MGKGITSWKRGLMLGIVLLAVVLAVLGGDPLPVQAAPLCRTVNGHEICILTIKRSAKYFWEYRAAVRIDGQERPLEKYDCRHQVRIGKNGTRVPFEPGGAGELICQLTQ